MRKTGLSAPLFSVIVPAYNAESFLGECLSSVAMQTYRGFELIVVDDGSIDGTRDILEEFVQGYGSSHAIAIHQSNKGRLAARRAGLEMARGEYVVFLDADDVLRHETLEILSEVISRTRADILAFGMASDFGFEHPHFCDDLPFGDYVGSSYDLVKKAVLRGRFNGLCGKALARYLFDLGSNYRPYFGLMHGEDLFQLLPVVDNAESCVHIDRALYYYRRHEGSSTMRYRSQQLDDVEVAAKRLLEYGEKWGMPRDAAFGALWNICCTVKCLLKDRPPHSTRDVELRRFVSVIKGLDLFSYANDQRIDNALLLRVLIKGRFRAAESVVRVLELCKRVLPG